MNFLVFVVKRIIGLLVVLLITSFVVFGLTYIAPGSPLSFLLGPRGGTPELIAHLQSQYHLNDPFFIRYFAWLFDVMRGNFGDSIVYHQSVLGLIVGRLDVTVWLVGLATFFIAIIGVASGVLASVKRGWVDHLITTLASIGLATPNFVVGVILISIFAVSLGWLPTNGSGSGLLDRLFHMILPAISLAVASTAFLARITRAAMLEEMEQEYTQTAIARGLPTKLVIRRHVLRNALIPITTVLGLTIATLIAGAVVIESVFALNGIGSLLIRAILQRDFPVVQAVILILVIAFVLINAIVDLLYTAIDPRIKLGR